VNWRLGLAALGGVVGGILWAARRKRQLTASDSALWAEATDPVARFGDG
jgi:hypothetical protein